jgi:hypothetical protein
VNLVAVAVAVGVEVGVDAWYVKVQVNSATGPLPQLNAPAGICMVLRPCVTGVVLKWNTMVMFPLSKAKAFAVVPFTVKSLP